VVRRRAFEPCKDARRVRRSPLFPIFLIVLVDVFGLTLVIPLLAFYAEHFGATPLMATALVSTYAACQLFAAPYLGDASDRVGRKPILLLSQAGTCIGFLVMARANALWVVFLARAIDGATAGNLTIAQAYISDNTTKQQRTTAFALIGIAFGVGFFLGPAVSGLLSTYSLSAPIYLAAALSLTSIACTTFLLPKEAGKRTAEPGDPGPGGRRISPLSFATYRAYLARPVLGGLFLQFLFFSLAFATFTSGFALFAERRFTWHGHPFTAREVGMVFAYVGFLGILIQGGLIRKLVPKFGEPILVAVGFASMSIGYAALGNVGAISGLVLVSTVSSFGNAILRPALSGLVTHAAGPGEQGLVLGITQSLNSTAQIAAPLLGGFLIGNNWLSWWARVAALAAAGGLVAGLWGSQRMPKHAGSPAPEV
jgi:DHA1 family tetracycline resistance protein-like MFS transporter